MSQEFKNEDFFNKTPTKDQKYFIYYSINRQNNIWVDIGSSFTENNN